MAGEEAPAPATGGSGLTIEAIVAVDSPREFRIHPRDRVVAFTAEAAGARQLFTLSLRGTGAPADPDHRLGEGGQRPAVVARRPAPGLRPRRRDLDRRGRRVAPDPCRRQAGRRSRAALVTGRSPPRVPVPAARLEPGLARSMRRSRAAVDRSATRGRRRRHALTQPGFDVDALAWSPDGARIAVTGAAGARRPRRPAQIAIVDVATGASEVVAGARSHDTGAQLAARRIARLRQSTRTAGSRSSAAPPDGRDRIVLTDGEREHGEPSGGYGYAPLPSPDGEPRRPHRGPRRPHRPGRPRPRRRRRRRSVAEAGRRRRRARSPRRRPPPADLAVGRRVARGRLAARRGLGRGDRRERDAAAGPVAAARPGRGARRSATAPGHRLAAGRPRVRAGRRAACRPASGSRSRPATASASRARSGGRPARPASAAAGASRRSSTRTAARRGRRTAAFQPFKLLLARRGLRVPRRRLPRLDRATAARSATPTTTSGATPTSTTSSTPRAGPASSPGPTAGSRSTAGRTAATWSCARSSRSRRCGRPASTCTATPRSPRASATATGPAGSTCSR